MLAEQREVLLSPREPAAGWPGRTGRRAGRTPARRVPFAASYSAIPDSDGGTGVRPEVLSIPFVVVCLTLAIRNGDGSSTPMP
ncbi:hypothetical protein HBB16_08845 [Pseudonocardia sp. MCCB 268]|nr:hypothetical protein [Pseudonocardia cytotoxica]